MKKFLPIWLTILLFLFGCAGPVLYGSNQATGYTIEQKRNPDFRRGWVSIEYLDYSQFKELYQAKLQNELASESEIAQAMQAIPKGGFINVKIRRTDIKQANTARFQYVVKDDDNQRYRKKGQNDVADLPVYTGGYHEHGFWRNTDSVPVKNPIENNIVLYVIDDFGNRDEFRIIRP